MKIRLPKRRNDRMDVQTLIAISTTLVFWASAFAGIRAALVAYTPGHVALLRFLVASSVLAVYAVLVRMPLPDRNDLPALLLLGFIGITVYHVALTYGEVSVSAGVASLLIASGPIFTALFAMIILGERLNIIGWSGIALSFFGIALVVLSDGGGGAFQFNFDAIGILLAAFATSLYFVLQKPYLRKYGALQLTAYTVWAGTFLMLVFFPGLPLAVRLAPFNATLAVLYLGIFPAALAYVMWSFALSRAPASVVASFLYLSPVLATVIAWIWLGEVPASISLVGGFLSLLGVLLVNTWGR